MKTDFPAEYNPENAPSTPGYRFLGEDEPRRVDDETPWTDKRGWVRLKDTSGFGPLGASQWTVRRAICVDDPYAPPPSEWCHPDWMIVTKPQPDASMQWWHKIAKSWEPCYAGCAYAPHFYYRRPIGNPPMITSPAPTNDWIPFSVRKPTDAEAGAGIWTVNMKDSAPYADLSKYGRGFFSSNVGSRTHWKPGADAFPPLPKSTLPPAPKLDGVGGKVYEMLYTKPGAILKEPCVTFGCAHISVNLLECAKAIMDKQQPGNRTIKAITLDSGVSINHTEIREILDYVNVVNKS